MRTGFEMATSGPTVECRVYRAAPADTPRGSLASAARDPRRGSACVLVGRLYYKDDLVRAFPALAGRSFASDAEWALAAFTEGGPAALPRLEGEFSVAIYDPSRRAVFAYRDPMGAWALYHGAEGGVLRVGTGLLNLARQCADVALNHDYLGSFLMWPFPAAELPERQTALRPLRRVLPGELVQLRADGEAQTLFTHAWPTHGERPGVTADEASETFGGLFRAAVKERLGPVRTAAHLSGGLDSSAVVCVARDLLAGEPLTTLSLVYEKTSLANETDWVRMVLEQGGALDARSLDGDAIVAFDWFDDGVPEHDEPYTGLAQCGTDRRMAAVADAAGAATILTGYGAEAVSEGMPFGLADLVRRFRWRSALAEARRWARATNDSARGVLWRNGIEPLLPGWLREGVGALLRGGRAVWPNVGLSDVPPWVTPDFSERYGLWAKGRAAVRRLHAAPYEQTANHFAANAEAGDWSTGNLTGPRGLHNSRPFFDPRLVRFCLSLPASLRLTPGVSKPLLRAAMRGILPEPIRTRIRKGNFNDVYRLGLARHLGQLEEMVRRSPVAAMGVLDPDMLCVALNQVAAGVGEIDAASRLNVAMALVAWCDQLSPALRRPADRPSEVLATAGHSPASRVRSARETCSLC